MRDCAYTASMHDVRDSQSANPIRYLDLDLHFCKQQLKTELDNQL